MTIEHIITLAETYAAHQKLSLSTVSSYAANDGKRLNQWKNGAGCTLKRATAVVTWFSTHWPEDLEWPSDIPRPSQPKPTSGRAA